MSESEIRGDPPYGDLAITWVGEVTSSLVDRPLAKECGRRDAELSYEGRAEPRLRDVRRETQFRDQSPYPAPDSIRVRFKDRYKTGLVSEAARMRPRKGSDPIVYKTNVVIRGLARRIQQLNAEMRDIDEELERLIQETAPSLLALYGVGVDTGADLLVTVGDNPDRLHTERSWAHLCGVTPIPAGLGKTSGKVRLNRGGDRQANAALYRIVLTRMSGHAETRNYVRRRRAEASDLRL